MKTYIAGSNLAFPERVALVGSDVTDLVTADGFAPERLATLVQMGVVVEVDAVAPPPPAPEE